MKHFTTHQFEIVAIQKKTPVYSGFWRATSATQGASTDPLPFPQQKIEETKGMLTIVIANLNMVCITPVFNETKVFYNNMWVELHRVNDYLKLNEQPVISFEVSVPNGEVYSRWTLYTNIETEGRQAKKTDEEAVSLPYSGGREIRTSFENGTRIREIPITSVRRCFYNKALSKFPFKGHYRSPTPFATKPFEAMDTTLYLVEKELADSDTGINVPFMQAFFLNRWVTLNRVSRTSRSKDQQSFFCFEVKIEGEGARNYWLLKSDILVPKD